MDKEKINTESVFRKGDFEGYTEEIYEAANEIVSLLEGVRFDRAKVILDVVERELLPYMSIVTSPALGRTAAGVNVPNPSSPIQKDIMNKLCD